MFNAILTAVVIVGGLTVPAYAQQNRFNELVGRWVNLQEGHEIRIESDGMVFAQSGEFPLSGAAGRCITGGGNFCFEGRTANGIYRCAYHIAFLEGNRVVNYRVTSDSYVGCPSGMFSRSN
jgi:hypothetical protein